MKAELYDGTILEFEDGTSEDVIQRVVREQTKQRVARERVGTEKGRATLTEPKPLRKGVDRGDLLRNMMPDDKRTQQALAQREQERQREATPLLERPSPDAPQRPVIALNPAATPEEVAAAYNQRPRAVAQEWQPGAAEGARLAVREATGSNRLASLARGATDAALLVPETVATGAKLATDIANMATLGAAQPLSDWLGAVVQGVQQQKSARYQKQQGELAQLLKDDNAGLTDVLAFLANNPAFTAELGIPSLPSMLVGAGAARAGAALNTALAARTGAGVAGAGNTGAMAGAAIGNTAMNAGATFSDTQGDLGQKLAAAGGAAAGTALAGRIPGAEVLLATGRGGSIAGTALREGVQESAESMSQSLGQGAAESNFDLGESIKQMGVEGTIGAVLGGGAAMVAGREPRPQATPEQEIASAINQSAESFARFFASPDAAILPTQARAESVKRLDEMAAAFGLSPKALTATKQAVSGMPADSVPEFLARAVRNMEQERLFAKPLDVDALQALAKRLRPPEKPPKAEAAPEPAAPEPAAPADEPVAVSEPAEAAAPPAPEFAIPRSKRTPEQAMERFERLMEQDYAGTKAAGRAEDAPDFEPREATDILSPKGAPWATKAQAVKKQREVGGRVARVNTGWVVKPETAQPELQPEPEATPDVNEPDVSGTAGLAEGAADERAPDGLGSVNAVGPRTPADGGSEPAAADPAPSGTGAVAAGGGAGERDAALTAPASPRVVRVSETRKPGLNGIQEPEAATLRDKAGNEFEVRRAFRGRYDFFVDGKPAGAVLYAPTLDGTVWKVSGVEVNPEFRRRGIATAVYDFLESEVIGGKLVQAGGQSEDGRAFRAARSESDVSAPFTAGDTFTIDGKPYTVTKATPKSAVISDADGKKRTVTADGKTWAAMLEQKTRAAAPQPAPEAPRVEAPAPAADAGAAAAAPDVSSTRDVARVEADGVMPAGLRVTFGGKTFPVASINDAQAKWAEFRDRTGAGVSEVGNGVRVTDGAGRFVARISYNGRAFDAEDSLEGGGNMIAEAPDSGPTPAPVEGDGVAEADTTRFPPVSQFDSISVGPGGRITPKPIVEGQPLYRETDLSGLDDLLRGDLQADFRQMYVADNPDLAIGQGVNKGVRVTFRPGSLSGRENRKPGTGDIAGREYVTDLIAPRAVQSITLPAADAKRLRGITKLRLSDFDRVDNADGTVTFNRKGLAVAAPAASPAPAESATPTPEKPASRRKRAQAEKGTAPATPQAAIDAFNADDSAQAVAIMAKLKREDLGTVGDAVGFRPQVNESAKAFRERIGGVADKLTKTAREKAKRQRVLFDKLTDRAMQYDRSADHAARAKANGVADDSTAYLGFYRPMGTAFNAGATEEMRIPALLDRLAADVASLKDDPDYAEVAPMVQKARPRVFDHKGKAAPVEAKPAEEAATPPQEPADPAAPAERYAAGKALTKAERKQVLDSLVDVYKAKGADREQKGIGRDGNERYGYVHSPELFEKSDITGAMVRYYVTLPDGRKAHPTELFPDYTQSDIDAEMAAREARKRDRQSDVQRATVPAQQFSTIREAVEWWDKRSRESTRTATGLPTIFPSEERRPLTNGSKFILVPNTTSGEMLEAFAEAGWQVQRAEQPAPASAAPPAQQAEPAGDMLGEFLASYDTPQEAGSARKALAATVTWKDGLKGPLSDHIIGEYRKGARVALTASGPAFVNSDMRGWSKRDIGEYGMQFANWLSSRDDAPAQQAEPSAPAPEGLGTPVKRGMTVAQFDAWAKENAKRQPEQFAKRTEGVGLFAVTGENKGFKQVAGVVGSRTVADDTRDMRVVYRLDDGRLVWWRQEDGNAYEVAANDPRLTITMAPPQAERQQVERTVLAGTDDEASILFAGPIEQMDDAEFEDELRMAALTPKQVAAFRALRTAAPAPAEPTTLAIEMGGSTLDVDLGKPVWQATEDEVQAAVAAAGFSSEKRGKYDPMMAWREAHGAALNEAKAAGKPIPARVLYDNPHLIRDDLSDDQADLAAEAMVDTYRATKDYERAVQAYRDFGRPAQRRAEQGGEAITDVGEKIGGARKDTAISGGTKTKRTSDDDRPAWARRFQISQIVTPSGMLGEVKDAGRWIIRDAKNLDRFTKQPQQVGRVTYATKEEAEAFVPIAAVGMKHRPVSTRDGKYEIWREITDRKRVKVVDKTFDTRDEAMAYMVANAVPIIETSTTFGEADIPLPPDRARTGLQRRTGNVKGEDFKESFGFRGVEFGNWNNQDERQALMNDAFDGLMDLADVLGIPPKAIGLNGDLALAFGARGHGLQSARAHYELDRAVINLTKEKGAGSLAHEWFHALDHYFGRQDGKSSAEWVVNKDGTRSLKTGKEATDDMASGGFTRNRSGVRPEVREAYERLLSTMTKKAQTYVEETAKVDKFTGTAREELAAELDRLRRDLSEQKDPKYWKRNNKPASAELLAEFDEIARKMLAGEMLETDWRMVSKPNVSSPSGKVSAARWTNDSLERLGAIYKEVRGRSGFSADKSGVLDRLRGTMTRYSERLKLLAEAQSGTEKVKMVPTDFAMNAKELDQGRGTDYWTTPHEMAARAFQGYVEDKIAERGGVSRFLNYGPESAGILTPWGFKRPFPTGDERKAINAALDKFVGALQTRTDDAGNVALFSRSIATPRPINSPAELEALVDELTASWTNSPGIVVFNGMQDKNLPKPIRDENDRQMAQGAQGEPDGVFYAGTIYLNAAAIPTDADAARTLYHEALGHAGMRGLFGPALAPMLDQMAVLNRPAVEAKAKQYGLNMRDRQDRRIAAEEVLAELAQTRPSSTWVTKAVNIIRQWLRENVPYFRDLAMSRSELIETFIAPARGFVERGRFAESPSQMPVFSRAPAINTPEFRRQQNEAEEARHEQTKAIAEAVNTYITDKGTLGAWSKTIGTPARLAKTSPTFKKFFDALLRHQADVSNFANTAADLAPDILPKLDKLTDLMRGPIKAKDAEAMQRPLFDGTLLWTRDANGKPVRVKELEDKAAEMSPDDKARQMLRDRKLHPRVMAMWQGQDKTWFDAVVEKKYAKEYLRPGIVWTDKELKDIFGLTPKQIGYYKQARAAVDKSVDDLTVTTMLRLAQDPALRTEVLGMSPSEAAEYLRPIVEDKARADALKAGKTDEQADDAAEQAGNQITDLADRAEQLKDEGYVPLMRFGNRYTKVVQDGEMVYFAMYESSIQRTLDRARLRKMFPGATLKDGTVSVNEYKAFEGVNPETLAMFADIVGISDDPAKAELMQTYLRDAVNQRSALKRLIHRKGIAGFNEDVPRVLASFVTSNARLGANNLNTKPIMDAIEGIDPRGERTGQGELKDYAQDLYDFTRDPGKQWATLRGMLFGWFLGGNVSSAFINMQQPFQTTMPELSKIVGAAEANKLVMEAIPQSFRRQKGELGEALKRGELEGKVSPQEFHHLIGYAQGKGHFETGKGVAGTALALGNNGLTRLAFLWSRMFSWAEQFNRRVTFIAGYKAAKKAGHPDPYKYAVDLIDDTQFIYGLANRPVWMRTGAGATLFTFQSYQINMLESFALNARHRGPAGRKTLALMMLVLLLSAGVGGLPFMGNLEDVIDGILQRGLDLNVSVKEKREEAIRALMGLVMDDELADLTTRFIERGVTGLAVSPLDLSTRFSMARPIPGTGMFPLKRSVTSDVADIAGPAGSFAEQMAGAAAKAVSGDIKGAAKEALPLGGKNLFKGIEMGVTGEYRDGGDRNVIEVSKLDAVLKGAGFQPNVVATRRNIERPQQRRIEIQQIVEQDIVGALARAVRDNMKKGGQDKLTESKEWKEALERLERWNRRNPENPIAISAKQVQARVNNMMQTSDQRMIKRAPPEIRGSVATEVAR